MESSTRSPRFCALLVFSLLLAGGLQAQNRNRARIKFTDFELNNVPTPEYKDATHPQAKGEHEWLQIFTEYEASGGRGGWLDQVELRWYVLVKTAREQFILLQAKVVYLDVETKGEKHHAVVYIRPAFSRRYFDKERIPKANVWVRVEAVVNGQVVETEKYGRSKSPPGSWWQAKEPRVKHVADTLLTRDRTPFAPMDYDFYEHIKPSTGIR
ncbi:MAG: hypothetical protein HN849_31860 [Victivallales bacterium]|jgi:hypothetical protein|nr:hypothetical protein [Victivallales bacterium]MBT7165332.1 hypothetical protein [Victivallales bacterium]MBT7304172.1 hypothetical protein [Victivallales bacterium]